MTAYELGMEVAQRALVPGHLKQAYAEGFAGAFEKRANRPPWFEAFRNIGRRTWQGTERGLEEFPRMIDDYVDHNNQTGLLDRENRVEQDIVGAGTLLAGLGTYGAASGIQRLLSGKTDDKDTIRKRRLRSLIAAAIAAGTTGATGVGLHLMNRRYRESLPV